LQLGPVNLFVINSALYDGKKTAYYIAIGGCIPEFIYCALAVFANSYLIEYKSLIFLLKIGFITILIIVGFIFYFKKQSNVAVKNETNLNEQPIQYILKGLSLAVLNPQLLPFWIFIQIYFNSIPFLKIQSNFQKFSYILGSGVGAFILLAFFIHIVIKYREKILKYVNNKYYFKALSLLFFAIAGHQIWLLINS
jgi:threonine/homoserine/homoserine lactone efflux protein